METTTKHENIVRLQKMNVFDMTCITKKNSLQKKWVQLSYVAQAGMMIKDGNNLKLV